jgi:Na+-driven multidrug efflux pump
MASRPGQRDLTSGPIGGTLIAFAVPTLASSILQSLNGSINAIWVGRFLGEDALAATSNANLVMFLLMAFVFGFGMAATVLIGQAMGRRDVDGARRVIGTAIGGFLPFAAAVALVGWFGAPGLLRLLATPGDAMPLALAYLRVIFLAMPGILILIVLMMGLRGGGDAMTPLWFMILAVVLDSGLNPVLILGLGPAPELGIAGSALATVIANYGALLGLVVYIYVRDLPMRLRGRELGYLKPDGRLLRAIAGIWI